MIDCFNDRRINDHWDSLAIYTFFIENIARSFKPSANHFIRIQVIADVRQSCFFSLSTLNVIK